MSVQASVMTIMAIIILIAWLRNTKKMQKILFIGGSGQMGKKMIDIFSKSYNISNIDFISHDNAA
jgi:ABC-type phosphate/phosphonate transport system permease subunit